MISISRQIIAKAFTCQNMKGIYILYSLKGGYWYRLLKGAEETRYKVKNT